MSKSWWVVVLVLAGCGGSASSAGRGPGSSGAGPDGAQAEGEGGEVDLGPPAPLGGEDPCPPQPLTLADTLDAVLGDVRTLPASERPFLRYVSTAQFRGAGCNAVEGDDAAARTVERARRAVSKASNGLSREPAAVVPAQVGPDGLLLRLDLRDYGWQRGVTVAGQSYGDAWEALAARTGTALALQGGTASELEQELGTSIPVLLSSSFVAASVRADVYYGILELPGTLPELRQQLGIDGEQGLERGPWARAAFSNSGVSTEPRGVARYRGTALGDGFFWQTFEHAPSARSTAQYLDPLATTADGHMALFSLPNGLPAYFVSDGAGQRLDEARFVVDPAQNNGRMRLVASCLSCHNLGIVTFVDAVRPFVEDNPDLFSEAELARVLETFPPQSQLQALISSDGGRIVAAQERAGHPRRAGDPVSRVALEHDQALSFGQLAAELFLERAALIAELPRLPEAVAAAATSGRMERAMFEALYQQLACVLYGSADSAPVGCP